jgi:hypothetical protein
MVVDSPRVFEFRDEDAGQRTFASSEDARMLFLCPPVSLMEVNRGGTPARTFDSPHCRNAPV